MPLGTREMLLVIRARDVASRVVREVGTSIAGLGTTGQITGQQLMNAGAALTGIGVTIGAMGAAGLLFLNDATDAAIEYNRQAALTKTQVDDASVSVSQLGDIGRRVAAEIPAPFDQMQAALYDIFSSMDVNVMQAESLLTGFSKSAVAGQVEIQTAARSTISILNAYQLPVEDLNHIMDIQFQLVRKGVGTYEEFNTSLGRAIPAAVAAGQNIETLAGMMAFLTRNGLSTEMAATSAARAMELFADPDKFKGLEDIGVTVRDSAGNFLQMNDIITQLATNQGWAQMAEPQRKEMFEDIFGQGTIQARRFFDLAVPNFEQLNSLTGSMYDSAGALDAAYGTMFDEPAMKAQLLANQYEILKTEIGEELIPVKIKLMEQVQKLIDWWNGLSEGTQDLIIKIVAFGSAIAVVVGIVLTVVGAFAMLVGGIMMMGASFGAAIAIIAIVPLVIAAIIAIIVVLVVYWDEIKNAAGVAWEFIKEQASSAWQMMQDFWDWISRNAVGIWHTIHDAATTAWEGIKSVAVTVWQFFVGLWQWFNTTFGEGFKRIWNTIWEEAGNIFEEVGETITAVVGYLQTAFEIWWSITEPIVMAFIAAWPLVYDVISFVVEFIVTAMQMVWTVITTAFDIIVTVISGAVEFIQLIWEHFGTYIITAVQNAWNFISTIISSVITIISNLIQLFLNVIQGDWGDAWENIKNIFGAAWDAIWAALQFVWGNIVNFFVNFAPNVLGFLGDLLSLLWQKGSDLLSGLWNGIVSAWQIQYEFFLNLPGTIGDFFLDAINWLWDAGYDILKGLWNGMKSAWEEVSGWLDDLSLDITDLKGPPEKDKRLLYNNGMLIMEGLHAGMQEGWKDVENFLMSASRGIEEFNPYAEAGFGASTFYGAPAFSGDVEGGGSRIGVYVENLHVSEENVVGDLDWWYSTVGTGV